MTKEHKKKSLVPSISPFPLMHTAVTAGMIFLTAVHLAGFTNSPIAHGAESVPTADQPATRRVVPYQPEEVRPAVVTQETFQTMDGFGVSTAWVAGHLHEWLDEPAKQFVLDMLFTEAGANLSIVRSKVEPDIAARGHDPGQEFLMTQAQQRGVTRFLATPWTPPAEWEDEDNRLELEHYQDYAQFLADYIKLYRDKGIWISWLSLQNEPDLSVEYESCVWTQQQFCFFVPLLRETLDANGLTDVQLIGPDAMGWPHAYEYIKHLIESEAHNAVDVWATHGYWGEENNEALNPYRESIRDLADQYTKKVWLTEWSDLKTLWYGDPNDRNVVGIEDGLMWAERIITDLTVANVSAWFYWWIYNPNPVEFPTTPNEGLMVRTPEDTFILPKRFYTFSHFSRFIRPGAQRVAVAGGPPHLSTVAFRSPDQQQLIVTVVNRTELATPLNLDFTDYLFYGNTQAYRTSETEDMVPLPEVLLFGNTLNTEIAPLSITTFLIPLAQSI